MLIYTRINAPSAGRVARIAAMCCALGLISGCATTIPIRATAYDVQVQLDPSTHMLEGRTTLQVRLDTEDVPDDRPVAIELTLNGALDVRNVAAENVRITGHSVRKHKSERKDGRSSPLVIHRLVLESARAEFQLSFDYAGEIVQDVQAGEKQGEIHNFLMSAHVSAEGVYLTPHGGWYPSPYRGPDEKDEGELADYRLTVDRVEGLELVAGATFDEEASKRSGRLIWKNTYPLDGLVLVGGPHQVKRRRVGDIDIALHYSPSDDADEQRMLDEHTDQFLEAAEQYVKRYEPLIGPYPFKQFTIVENFFSSGFAFPEFTLLARVLLEMGPKGLKHGYLDHEFLHSWWGNGVYVDPTDGNWCEALASYGANYYGFVLDGDEEGARKQRRNCCNFLSRIKPKNDKPLGTFGRKDGAGRGIGYSKGTMVFHMLARRIGQENFWAAMRHLTSDYVGKYASWNTLRTLFEQHGDADLEQFFAQWVRGGGAPNLKLVEASWHSDSESLEVVIDQGETDFVLDVPLRLKFAGGSSRDEIVRIDEPVTSVRLILDAAPDSVVLDPDYHVFRKLQPAEVMPTTAITRGGDNLLVLKPGENISPHYQTVIDRFGGEKKSKTIDERDAIDVSPEELSKQSVLILGDAVRNAHVQQLLAKTDCPITWQASGFTIEGVAYDQPQHSVLCTLHHPDIADGGITIYYGNSEDALGRSDLLLFYGNSLIVFATSIKGESSPKEFESEVVLRRDFESQESIDVAK